MNSIGARDHQHGRETVWRYKRPDPITTPNRYLIEPRLDAESNTLWENQFLEGPEGGNPGRFRGHSDSCLRHSRAGGNPGRFRAHSDSCLRHSRAGGNPGRFRAHSDSCFRHSGAGGNPGRFRPHSDFLSVIPAEAGIQGIRMKSCPVFLDSRLRGNDGQGRDSPVRRRYLPWRLPDKMSG